MAAPDLSSLGAGTSGLWTRSAASALLSTGSVDRHLRTDWQSPYPGVFADAGYVLDAVQWATAGVLASGGDGQPQVLGAPDRGGHARIVLGAIACGHDAARVWGYPLVDDDDPATGADDRFVHDVHTWTRQDDLLAPLVPGEPRRHELRRHTLTLYDGELALHPSGLWLTSALRTALDCCLLLSFEAAVCVVDDGLHRGLFSAAELDDALARRAGHAGVAQQRAVAAAADRRAEAASETLLRLVLAPGWPELEPQVRVGDGSGRVLRRYDLGDRELRLGVEADGKRGHAGAAMAAKDHDKDRAAREQGWSTERATWWQVRREAARLRRRVHGVRDALRARAA